MAARAFPPPVTDPLTRVRARVPGPPRKSSVRASCPCPRIFATGIFSNRFSTSRRWEIEVGGTALAGSLSRFHHQKIWGPVSRAGRVYAGPILGAPKCHRSGLNALPGLLVPSGRRLLRFREPVRQPLDDGESASINRVGFLAAASDERVARAAEALSLPIVASRPISHDAALENPLQAARAGDNAPAFAEDGDDVGIVVGGLEGFSGPIVCQGLEGGTAGPSISRRCCRAVAVERSL